MYIYSIDEFNNFLEKKGIDLLSLPDYIYDEYSWYDEGSKEIEIDMSILIDYLDSAEYKLGLINDDCDLGDEWDDDEDE